VRNGISWEGMDVTASVIGTLKICADLNSCLERMQEKILSKIVLNWFPPGRAGKSRRRRNRDTCQYMRHIPNILWENESMWAV